MSNTLTVGELKRILQNVIDELDNYEDDATVKTESNTYFVNSCYYAQIGSHGFVDFHDLDIEDEDEWEDEE